MRSLEELNYLPISTSQDDLKNRIAIVFDLLVNNVEGTNAEFAEAFVDVIVYQSYAGAIPLDCEKDILNWIAKTYDEDDKAYIEAVASLYCMMSSERALKELRQKLSLAKHRWVAEKFQEALDEFVLV